MIYERQTSVYLIWGCETKRYIWVRARGGKDVDWDCHALEGDGKRFELGVEKSDARYTWNGKQRDTPKNGGGKKLSVCVAHLTTGVEKSDTSLPRVAVSCDVVDICHDSKVKYIRIRLCTRWQGKKLCACWGGRVEKRPLFQECAAMHGCKTQHQQHTFHAIQIYREAIGMYTIYAHQRPPPPAPHENLNGICFKLYDTCVTTEKNTNRQFNKFLLGNSETNMWGSEDNYGIIMRGFWTQKRIGLQATKNMYEKLGVWTNGGLAGMDGWPLCILMIRWLRKQQDAFADVSSQYLSLRSCISARISKNKLKCTPAFHSNPFPQLADMFFFLTAVFQHFFLRLRAAKCELSPFSPQVKIFQRCNYCVPDSMSERRTSQFCSMPPLNIFPHPPLCTVPCNNFFPHMYFVLLSFAFLSPPSCNMGTKPESFSTSQLLCLFSHHVGQFFSATIGFPGFSREVEAQKQLPIGTPSKRVIFILPNTKKYQSNIDKNKLDSSTMIIKCKRREQVTTQLPDFNTGLPNQLIKSY
ncbi:hypothetical protein VP01_1204g1 [Puccinia sorghi]|uniref:Uncharacterized protein n=1 Tax=Puccinia sorghi TaxID=27349 RepID=A0A0L6VQH2_9BASI|nr:hypothetical protein VP01_1204g1 [Puccinia sorghi]